MENSYFDKWADIMSMESKLLWEAKRYILEHWEKIEDWSDLCVSVYNRDEDKTVMFYKYESSEHEEGSVIRKTYQDMHNPVRDVKEPVLDDIDGDFSITINGIDFRWIGNKAVIDIADYIERNMEK